MGIRAGPVRDFQYQQVRLRLGELASRLDGEVDLFQYQQVRLRP